MKFKLYLIPLAALILCVALAGIVRGSYTNIGEKIYGFDITSVGNLEAFKKAEIQSSQDLIEKSDLIVRVKFNGERLVTDNAFYSTVHISDVYKGDSKMKGKDIIITESMATFTDTKYLNGYFMSRWIPLQKDTEYLMLLKNIPFRPERKLNEFQQSQYAPITSSPAGCYRIGGQVQTKLFNFEKEKTTLNDLKGYAIYAITQEDLDRYYQLQNEVFKKLNIS